MLKSDSLMPPKVIAESVFFSPEINVADVANLFTPRTDTLDECLHFLSLIYILYNQGSPCTLTWFFAKKSLFFKLFVAE